VLPVEDDEGNREAMASFLAAEGYRVVPAVNGLEALHRLRDGADPSIILLDVQMPVMDGLQFRREQMRHAAIARIPVVVCSAEDDPRDPSLAAQHWLRKPVDPTELLTTLGEYVAPPSSRRQRRGTDPAAADHALGTAPTCASTSALYR
jgi:CheY-like chemotaxis protein